ncbi:hypothetical protein FNCP11_21560 [Fusobacterium nucleatum]|jgi:hypothetical protein|nr:hypothetical protein FNCP11_21560 [Fusobacterium nucleatum]BEP11241.1 hypothetical protein FNSP11_20850 [Fusobacterium nucleatum]
MIPIFKFLGIFIKNMKPIHIDNVVNELIKKLRK